MRVARWDKVRRCACSGDAGIAACEISLIWAFLSLRQKAVIHPLLSALLRWYSGASVHLPLITGFQTGDRLSLFFSFSLLSPLFCTALTTRSKPPFSAPPLTVPRRYDAEKRRCEWRRISRNSTCYKCLHRFCDVFISEKEELELLGAY